MLGAHLLVNISFFVWKSFNFAKKKYIVNLSWGNDAEIEVQECDTLDDALKVCKERGLPKDAIKEKKE